MERRAEPRVEASGHVRLRITDYLGANLEGVLLDTSAQGFRASHNCPTLAAGQTVLFEHSRAKGRARVVWTRIDGEQVQSGFYVMP